MPAIGEMLAAVSGDLQPRLVDERRGLQGLPHPLIGHADGGQLAQFLIDQWEQLVGGLGITCVNGMEQLGDVGHGREPTLKAGKSECEE